MPDGFLLDEATIRRIAAALRKVEGSIDSVGAKRPGAPLLQTSDIQAVRVTDLTQTENLYPGRLLKEAHDGTVTDLGECWVKELNDDDLQQTRYLARRSGKYKDKLVFTVDLGSGGGSSVALIRVSSCTPAAGQNGLFPGYIQNWNTSTKRDVDGPACWVREPNGSSTLQIGYHLGLLRDSNGGTPIYDIVFGPRSAISIQDSNCNTQYLWMAWGMKVTSESSSPC